MLISKNLDPKHRLLILTSLILSFIDMARAANLFDVTYNSVNHNNCLVDEDSYRSSGQHFLDIISDGQVNRNGEWYSIKMN